MLTSSKPDDTEKLNLISALKTGQSGLKKTDDSPTNSQDQLLAALKNGQSQLKKAPPVRGEATNAKRLLFMSEASEIISDSIMKFSVG
jgi:hypothetical protein